jgi:hypothetical protein
LDDESLVFSHALKSSSINLLLFFSTVSAGCGLLLLELSTSTFAVLGAWWWGDYTSDKHTWGLVHC